MGVLIKILLIFLGIYFVGKFIFRGIFSALLGESRNLHEQIRSEEAKLRQKKRKKEGEVTINYQPKPDKDFGKDDGEYIDFEEVK